MASPEAEIKVEGAVEMANDPNSSVTAKDAENKLVEESKKAGVAAFQFDPDATPEEKAAQARAVRIDTTIDVLATCTDRL